MIFDFDALSGREPEDNEIIKNEITSQAGIYIITVDGKVLYVGKSLDIPSRINTHKWAIKYNDKKETKYYILKAAQDAGKSIRYDIIYYSKYQEKDIINRELLEKEAYYINYYLPPLNTIIPNHSEFNSQSPTVDKIVDINDALNFAKAV